MNCLLKCAHSKVHAVLVDSCAGQKKEENRSIINEIQFAMDHLVRIDNRLL